MAGFGREKGDILKVIKFCFPGQTFRVLKKVEENGAVLFIKGNINQILNRFMEVAYHVQV